MKKFLSVFILLLILLGISLGNEINKKKESLKNKKNYLKASFEVIGINTIIWAYDRYVKKANWVKISTHSIWRNIKRGYYWDNNSFQANQLDHPYQGSLFWSSSRINGLSFWESIIFPFFGSLMWEIALENNQPSTNDAIMTTLGGMTFGEVLFRLSNLIIKNQAQGFERGVREAFAFIVSPIVVLDRVITGKSFKTGRKSEKHYYELAVPIGIYKNRLIGGVNLEYLDAIKKNNLKISPYDYFTFDLRAKIKNKRLKIERILTNGLLIGRRVEGKNLIGIFGDFDYISIPGNKISAVGFGPGFVLNIGKNSILKISSGFSGIFGGASSSFVLTYGEKIFRKHGEHHRFGPGSDPYYLGPGIKGKFDLGFERKNFIDANINISYYWVDSIFGTNAEEYVTRLCFRGGLNLFKWSQIGIEYEFYFKKGTYREYTPISKKFQTFIIFYIFRF
ncbi:DUF3943 domain-containing protein [Candidatus Aminicenantes bacterium AH-873-B07]|nr:DUF3943 domain-containing protein [Candidatus Aminicenantes bacterium AH-873-B07]